MFELRFASNEINHWAAHYVDDGDSHILNEISPDVRDMGYFSRTEFLHLCAWKSPRTKKHCQKNSEDFIKSVTQIALSTNCEQLRIEILTLLNGVSWPTASVLLHFGHRQPYPILDYRALWSLGRDKPPNQYSFDFWWAYTQYCRTTAEEAQVTMRDLDRALWQYSKEHQSN